MAEATKRGLSGAALKWLALLSMLLDHTGAVLGPAYLRLHGAQAGSAALWLYHALRAVGRLAFPLFCFLLAEGFAHTRSRGRYLLRLLLFALLSELPFDLAFRGAVLETGYQNVFFTLTLGLAALWGWESLTGGELRRCGAPRRLAALLAAAAAAAAAELLRTDYGSFGVLLILAFWLTRTRPPLRDPAVTALLGLAALLGRFHWSECLALAALPLLRAYNGRRGRQPQALFYVFYPAHLLLLCLLRRVLLGG